ncbi:MAG: LysR family transcriptional regulator [Proteobacteria bacterium]|nr:MAG: LysR family transcriptional regulator [Pseudomonadota bacterium]
MDKDKLDGLLALKLVAEKRNFTAAADELNISAPAISKIIKNLEERLGIALLSRTTRSTSLTEAGEKFLNQAGPALDQILNAIDDVGTYSKKPLGVLRLNVPRMVYPVLLAPIITSFLKKYPDVSVEVFFEDAASDIVGNGFDAGVRLSDILAEDMVAVKLFGPVKFVIAGSPVYFKRKSRPKHPKDLLDHNCIMVRVGTWIYDKWEFEQKGKPFQVKVKGSLMLNDSFMALKAAVDGVGLMFVNEDAIAPQLKSGDLEIVLEQYASLSTGFYLYYPKRSQVQPKLRAFIDHIRAISP